MLSQTQENTHPPPARTYPLPYFLTDEAYHNKQGNSQDVDRRERENPTSTHTKKQTNKMYGSFIKKMEENKLHGQEK